MCISNFVQKWNICMIQKWWLNSENLKYCCQICCANFCLSVQNELLSQSGPVWPTYQDCSQLITAQQRHSHQHTLNIIINISHSRSINDKNYTASHTARQIFIISDYFTMAPSSQCVTNEPPCNEMLVDIRKILILDSARSWRIQKTFIFSHCKFIYFPEGKRYFN